MRPDSVRRFFRDRRGGIALKFALIFPVAALVAIGAIDLHAVEGAESRLQAIADAAALAGGAELGMAASTNGPVERARRLVAASLAEWADAPETTPVIEVLLGEPGALRVHLAARRPSFFGNMMPPGGWRFNVEAIASPAQLSPLCVLSHGSGLGEVLRLEDRAQIRAGSCRVHSNDQIAATGSSSILASLAQSVGAARGNIREAPQTGAPPIPDPYSSQTIQVPGACSRRAVVEIRTSISLGPGLHCDDLIVSGRAQLTLSPGDHYFSGNRLELRDQSRLIGSNVALVFDHAAFDFLGDSRVTLGGRTEGALAGFVIVGLRPPQGWCPAGPPRREDDDDDDDDGGAGVEPSRPADCMLGSEFLMASDNVDDLDGVIYTPASRLIVSGTREIAEGSDWTVMVVERLVVRGRPILVVNSDYRSSDVPVPSGVGPRTGGVHLIR